MKTSPELLLFLLPAAIATDSRYASSASSAVDATPSLPTTTTTPSASAQSQFSSQRESYPHMIQIPDVAQVPPAESSRVSPPPVLDQFGELSMEKMGLKALSRSKPRGMTHELHVRSEGTLGQTPWIGMAIGLTCTALAAVMLG